MAHLIKSLVDRAVPPKSGQLFLRDDEITGFALPVTSYGAKSFVWEGRPHVSRYAGQIPGPQRNGSSRQSVRVQSQDRARGKPGRPARRRASGAARGKNLRATGRRILEPASETAQTILARDERRIRRHIPSSWSSRRLSDFSRHEMVRLHQTIVHEHGHYAANRLVALLRTMLTVQNTGAGSRKTIRYAASSYSTKRSANASSPQRRLPDSTRL